MRREPVDKTPHLKRIRGLSPGCRLLLEQGSPHGKACVPLLLLPVPIPSLPGTSITVFPRPADTALTASCPGRPAARCRRHSPPRAPDASGRRSPAGQTDNSLTVRHAGHCHALAREGGGVSPAGDGQGSPQPLAPDLQQVMEDGQRLAR